MIGKYLWDVYRPSSLVIPKEEGAIGSSKSDGGCSAVEVGRGNLLLYYPSFLNGGCTLCTCKA